MPPACVIRLARKVTDVNGNRISNLRRRWAIGLAALCTLLGAALPLFSAEEGVEEARVAIEKWVYSRERKTINSSNRVIANFSVKNVSGKSLEGVNVQVTLISGLGENVAGPLKQALGSIKPQGVAAAQVSANRVPAFGAYEIVVRYQGGEETWYSNSDTTHPQLKSKGLTQNTARVVVVGQEIGSDRTNQLAGQVRVRNEGSLEAKDVKLLVIYWGADKAGQKVKMGEWAGPLGNGKIPPGKEQTFAVRVPGRVPVAMKAFEVRVVCSETASEAQLSDCELAYAKDLEAAHWKFKRVGDKQQDLEVSCDVRNGLNVELWDVRLNIDFISNENGKRTKVKSHAHALNAPLKSSAIVPTSFTVHGLPKYDGYECSFEFGAGEARAAVKKPVAPQYQNKAAVEVFFKEVTTADDGTVMAVCSARNGLDHQVKDTVVTFRLLRQDGGVSKQAEKKLEDPLLSGEETSFVIRVPDGKGFVSYDSQVTFVQNGGAVVTVAQGTVAPKAFAPEARVPGPTPKETQAVVQSAREKRSGKTESFEPGGPMELP